MLTSLDVRRTHIREISRPIGLPKSRETHIPNSSVESTIRLIYNRHRTPRRRVDAGKSAEMTGETTGMPNRQPSMRTPASVTTAIMTAPRASGCLLHTIRMSGIPVQRTTVHTTMNVTGGCHHPLTTMVHETDGRPLTDQLLATIHQNTRFREMFGVMSDSSGLSRRAGPTGRPTRSTTGSP